MTPKYYSMSVIYSGTITGFLSATHGWTNISLLFTSQQSSSILNLVEEFESDRRSYVVSLYILALEIQPKVNRWRTSSTQENRNLK